MIAKLDTGRTDNQISIDIIFVQNKIIVHMCNDIFPVQILNNIATIIEKCSTRYSSALIFVFIISSL